MYDQAAKLRDYLRNNQPFINQEGRVISVISGKGGVGKSNISLNLSILLKEQQKKVLLIDMDIGMGNQDILIGRSFPFTLADYFHEKRSFNELIEKGPLGIDMIAGGSGLSNILQLDKQKVENFLDDLSVVLRTYDFIILDMGAGMSLEAVSFISSSKEVIVVTTPEPPAIMDAYGAIKQIAQNQSDVQFSMIMNRVDEIQQAGEAYERISAVVKKFLQLEIVYLGCVFEDKKVKKAVQHQVPFVQLDRQGQAAKQLALITSQLLNEIEGVEQGSSTSFIQRLKHLLLSRR